jgi:hypothetical protein
MLQPTLDKYYAKKGCVAMKTFYRLDNIGKAKYTINFNDEIKTHKDGSPFFGMAIFKNKKKMNEFIKELIQEGYRESK